MTVYLSRSDGILILRARFESGDGTVGDLTYEVRPGQTSLGKTYEEWKALPNGPHWITLPAA
jgi:hypothetical protein